MELYRSEFYADDENNKNFEFEPVHPKNVLLASVVHGISCLFYFLLATYGI
jgi:hypothetical protein